MLYYLQAPPYNFDSALLAYTYRGLCDATRKKDVGGHTLVILYEFLQLWSWEYVPVGRPCMKK
jgi:hypothetical protein